MNLENIADIAIFAIIIISVLVYIVRSLDKIISNSDYDNYTEVSVTGTIILACSCYYIHWIYPLIALGFIALSSLPYWYFYLQKKTHERIEKVKDLDPESVLQSHRNYTKLEHPSVNELSVLAFHMPVHLLYLVLVKPVQLVRSLFMGVFNRIKTNFENQIIKSIKENENVKT